MQNIDRVWWKITSVFGLGVLLGMLLGASDPAERVLETGRIVIRDRGSGAVIVLGREDDLFGVKVRLPNGKMTFIGVQDAPVAGSRPAIGLLVGERDKNRTRLVGLQDSVEFLGYWGLDQGENHDTKVGFGLGKVGDVLFSARKFRLGDGDPNDTSLSWGTDSGEVVVQRTVEGRSRKYMYGPDGPRKVR